MSLSSASKKRKVISSLLTKLYSQLAASSLLLGQAQNRTCMLKTALEISLVKLSVQLFANAIAF